MPSGIKQFVKDHFSPAQKLAIKRGLVRVVGFGARTGAGIYRGIKSLVGRAEAYGLDLHRAWDVASPDLPIQPPPFGTQDLFLLKELISASPRMSETSADIRTSIVIPVYDHAELTFQCLRSLFNEVDVTTTEIIVANDASTDETGKLLELFGDRITVVNNEHNLGFGETCNRGAAVAKGKYLVFLNNDTWVLPGWLSELERSVEEDDSVGAVGSMFIYPDGRLQEAGAIIWRSGHTFHYGWGRSPDDHRFNFARQVDSCSAASLLIRTELFRQLGGFDPRYSPAYYEDTDLCMGVRQMGYKVLYQPASRLIHYEGATAGTDVRSGLKRYQVTNYQKFHDKWHETLEKCHAEDDPENPFPASDSRGMSILVIEDGLPTPDRDAGSARITQILRSLSTRYRPVFVPISYPEWPHYEELLWKMGVETTTGAEYLRIARKRDFPLAIVSRPDVAAAVIPTLRRRFPSMKVIFDMVDVHFVRFQREYDLTRDTAADKEAKRYKQLEAKLARMADLIWCASTEDERVMNELAPKTPSVVIPTIHPVSEHVNGFDEREGLLFIGSMSHSPNVDSLAYLIKDVMPLVRSKLPGVKLHVVGSGRHDISSFSSADTLIMGYVPDIEPLLASCKLMVAPLRFGAGMKGKIGESLAHGLPVVTTSIGAESIGIRSEVEVMIADTEQGLADAIVRAYNDKQLWESMSANGRQLVRARYAPEVIGGLIMESIERLTKGN